MTEYIHKTEEIVEKGKTITFENKTDTAFDVSVGVVFRKSGLYRVSIVDDKVSVEIGQERTEEPKHGKWMKISPAGIYECSECHQNVMTGNIEAYRFCHHCGARMDG